MEKRAAHIGLSVIFLFALSLFLSPSPIMSDTSPTASESTPDVVPLDTGPRAMSPADYPQNYTRVDWEQGVNSEAWTDTFSSSYWQFGPRITWTIRNATTDQLIEKNDTVAINGWANYILKIPKTAVGGQVPYAVAFSGMYLNLSEMWMPGGSDTATTEFIGFYEIPTARWQIYSTYNFTPIEEPPQELPPGWTFEDYFGPPVDPFMEMDEPACAFYVGPENIWAQFQLRFNTSAPLGLWGFHAIAFDNNLNMLAESREDELTYRAVGMPVDQALAQSIGGYFMPDRVDDDGNFVYSATRGVDFNTTVTIHGTNLDNASVYFSVPSVVSVREYVDGPYVVEHNVTGGWVYDTATGTYYWNDSIVVTYSEERWGYHWENREKYTDPWFEYQVYNPERGVTENRTANLFQAVVYSFGTDTWSTYLAYQMAEYVQDDRGHWFETMKWYYEPYPTNGTLPIVYVLNGTTSEHYTDGDNEVVVFRGHVSENITLPSNEVTQSLRVDVSVADIFGRYLPRFDYLPFVAHETFSADMFNQLAVDTPVSVVKLLHKGQPFEPSWMFLTDHGDTFEVTSRLQGGAAYADDIDGVAFVLTGWSYDWGKTDNSSWSQDAQVEIWMKASPAGQFEVTVYNYTHRVQYVYGETWEWKYVEVFPGYWEWRQVHETTWHWEDLVWDFKTNNWTTEYVHYHGNETVMPASYVLVGNLSYYVQGDDLRVSFDVTPTADMPELEWNWDYYYGNLTWVVDYEAGWGEHVALGWTNQLVYSYLDNGTRTYVDTPFKALLMRNNDTDVIYPTRIDHYVMIGGQKHFVKEFTETLPDGTTRRHILFEEWDPHAYDPHRQEYSGNWVHYYELLNGTRVYAEFGKVAPIYNTTLDTGESFLSVGNYTDHHWWNGTDSHMPAINGSLIVRPDPWNYTSVLLDTIPMKPVGLGVIANGSSVIYYATEPEWHNDHYVIYINSTWEQIEVWKGHCPEYNRSAYYYVNHTDGATYWLWDGVWPFQVYEGNFSGKHVIALDKYLDSYSFTTINGTEYELPYPGAGAWDPWDLESKTPGDIFVLINETWAATQYNGTYTYDDGIDVYDYDFYTAVVNGTTYNLTKFGRRPYSWAPKDEFDYLWSTNIGGSTPVPAINLAGWRVAYGHTDLNTREFVVEGWFDVKSGWLNDWGDGGITDWTGDTEIARLADGSVLNYTHFDRPLFYKVTLSNGTVFYTTEPYAYDFAPYDEDLGHNVHEFFYTWDLDGQMLTWEAGEIVNVTAMRPDDYLPGSPAQFLFQGVWRNQTTYTVDQYNFDKNSWESRPYENLIVESYPALVNSTDEFEIVDYHDDSQHRYDIPQFNFTMGATTYNVTGGREMIYKVYKFWGLGKKLDYAPLPITIVRQQWSVIVGAPKFGLWDMRTWTEDPNTGAIDLDGDLSTTNDQYYVRNTFQSTDTYNQTEQYLWVSILWEPNATKVGDEFHVDSYMGLVTVNWTTFWSDNYTWYKADSGAVVTPAEWAQINSTIFDDAGNPRPGYWDVAWMARNFTSQDLKKEAEEEGWDWAIQDSQEWSWIWWELSEHYLSDMGNGSVMSVDSWYEYAGLFSWEDDNQNDVMDFIPDDPENSEVTHYWLPDDVSGVQFLTPNASLTSGSENWPLNASVPFGVTFDNVSGTAYPFGTQSYWDWYQGAMTGSDFSTFDERPVRANVSEISLGAAFQGVLTGGSSNNGTVKFNVTIGNWDTDAPGGRSVLENRSLGIAFYTDVLMVSENGVPLNATYFDQHGQPVSGNQTVVSSRYAVAAAAAQVASMDLGGVHYQWDRNRSAMYTTVDAQTIPADLFEEAYLSDMGVTATPFEISTSQFYTLINYKWWDGYKVSVDPVFVSYSSSRGVTDNSDPSIDSLSATTRFVDGKERVSFEVAASDTGGSGVAEVWVYNPDGFHQNVSLEYNGDTHTWEGSVEMVGTDPYSTSFVVYVRDYTGNYIASSPIDHTFYNDPTPPTIDSIGVGTATSTSVLITASARDTDSGVDRVEIYIQNTEEAISMNYNSTTSQWEGYLTRSSDYAYTAAYKVRVYDAAGNMIESSTMYYNFPDNLAPVISDVSGTKGEVSGQEVLVVEVSVFDNGGSGLSSVQLIYTISGSDTTVDMTYDSGADVWRYTVPNQAPGTYVFYRVRATDGQGNVATTDQYVYRFSTEGDTPPGIGSLSYSPTSPTSSDAVNVSVTILDDGTILNATLYYKVDDGNWTSILMTASGSTYWAIIPAQPHGSVVTFYVVAYDNLEQRSQSAEASYTVSDDVSPPTISSVSIDKASPTSSDSVTVTATVTDDMGVYNVTLYYSVDGGAWIAVTMSSIGSNQYTGTIPPQADGSVVTYYVVAYDTAGKSSQSAQQSYTVSDMTVTTTETTTTETTSTTTGFTPGPGVSLDFGLLGVVGVLALVIVLMALMVKRKK